MLTRIFYKITQWQYLYSPSLPTSMNKFIMELLNVCKFLVIDLQQKLKTFSVINLSVNTSELTHENQKSMVWARSSSKVSITFISLYPYNLAPSHERCNLVM